MNIEKRFYIEEIIKIAKHLEIELNDLKCVPTWGEKLQYKEAYENNNRNVERKIDLYLNELINIRKEIH